MKRRLCRTVLFLVCAVVVPVGAAFAAGVSSATPGGLWQGRYDCAQGETALALRIAPLGDGRVDALFYFHALVQNPGVPSGCFVMTGRYDSTTRRLTLRPVRWLVHPQNFVWTGLVGRIGSDGAGITGRIEGPGCTDFALVRSTTSPVPPAPAECRLERDGPTV